MNEKRLSHKFSIIIWEIYFIEYLGMYVSMSCKERYIMYASMMIYEERSKYKIYISWIVHCCIVNCWIVYCKLAQPTEPDL